MKTQNILFAGIACLLFGSAFADGFAPGDKDMTDSIPMHVVKAAPKVKKAAPPKKFDPTEVHPAISIKNSADPEIILPGVMKIGGDSLSAVDPTRGRTMPIKNGQSQTIWLSAHSPNRIQLPFKNPYIIRDESTEIKKRAVSNNIYINFTDAEPKGSTQIFIESEDGSATIGLELVPKNIGSQTVIITDDRPFKPNQGNDLDTDNQIALSQTLLGDVQLGITPAGYNLSDINTAPIAFHGLVVTAKKRYSGSFGDVFVYDVTNPGAAEALIDESEFDGPEVAAVSCFPALSIKPSLYVQCAVLTTPRQNKGQ